jgi:hypothetical protein
MSALYESTLTGAEIDAGIGKAESALQPEDVVNALGSKQEYVK